MPTLKRRRDPDRQDCWRVFFGDVCVGTIGRRAGVPIDVDQWEWGCGFYPGTDPGKGISGTGGTLAAARAGFQAAWRDFLPMRTEADFQAWRAQRDWTAWKNEMRDRGLKLPTEFADGRSRCFCGSEIDIGSMGGHVRATHGGMVAG